MHGREAWKIIAFAASAAWWATGCTLIATHDLADVDSVGRVRVSSIDRADGDRFRSAGFPSETSRGRAERIANHSPDAFRLDDEFEQPGRTTLVSAQREAGRSDDTGESRTLPLPPDLADEADGTAGPQFGRRPVGRPTVRRSGGLELDEVLTSVRRTYPLLAAAFQARNIAEGEQTESWGEFDLKLKSTLIRQPQGFYENYRRSVGFEQPTYFGAQVFGGYRIVRGDVEPWYQERVTNRGGEFAGGILMPLLQGRRIDPRRAELWKATYGRTLTEYEIQEQGIDFTLGASLAYWEWVAAGEVLNLSNQLLRLAENRIEFLEKQIELERQPSIALVDNQRMIVSRQAKQIEAQQKLQQSAVKLSLFLRTPEGDPVVATEDMLPVLPEPAPIDPDASRDAIAIALRNRPELRQLIVMQKQLDVDRALAKNMMEPSVSASVYWSKDVGEIYSPYKKFDDKEPLTTEATLQVDVPLQRRKARGKMQAVEGKLAQNSAKRTFTENKITSEVQSVYVALEAAWQTHQRAVEAVELNRQLEKAELRKLELQRSDLLLLNIREQATFDARMTAVIAQLQYHQAQSVRRAVLAIDADSFAHPDCVPMRLED